jgi:hypothetical protein
MWDMYAFGNYELFCRELRDLPEKAPNGIKFTREEIDAVLGGNAARILCINP